MSRNGSLELKFDILFGFWSGEEIGLLGSSHFIKTWFQQEKRKYNRLHQHGHGGKIQG